jgi:hypothetical protein
MPIIKVNGKVKKFAYTPKGYMEEKEYIKKSVKAGRKVVKKNKQNGIR